MLVHGAWADGSSWNKFTTELQRRGFTVVAAQLRLTSLTDDATALRRVLRRQDTQVVLVGHPYAGAVITTAGGDDPQVKAPVYVTLIVPDKGETVGEIFGRVAPHPKAPKLQPDSDGLLGLQPTLFAMPSHQMHMPRKQHSWPRSRNQSHSNVWASAC